MSHSDLPILTYHAIDESGSVISTDPSRFAETMAALAESGRRAVDLGEWIDRGRPGVEKGFALTFDDGLRSVWSAAEVLARHKFTATLFLVTDRVGKRNDWSGQARSIPRADLLSWSELAQLGSAGFRFGAHSRTHPRLDLLDDETLEAELRGSREEIEERLGRPCRLLAYPYGTASGRVRLAASRYFTNAFTTRLAYATDRDDPFAIPRIDAYYLRSARSLELMKSDRWRARLRFRGVLRGAREWGSSASGALTR